MARVRVVGRSAAEKARRRRPRLSREDQPHADTVVCRLCGESFRTIGYKHLRAIHGWKGEHPIQEYKRRYGLPTACSRATLRLFSRRRAEEWERRGHHWTRPRILAALRARAAAHEEMNPGALSNALASAVARYFGSWEHAVRLAGLDPAALRRPRWDKARVVAAVRARHADGEGLSASSVRGEQASLHNAAYKHLGNWSQALRAAGLSPRVHRVQPKWSLANARAWVLREHAAGRTVVSSKVPSGLVNSVSRRTGMVWSAWIDSLGIPYPGQRKRLDWSRAAVVAEIRRRRRRGLPLNRGAVAEDSQAIIHQARKHFGSWDAALRSAGTDPAKVRLSHRWTRKEVLEAIRARHAAGRSLRRVQSVAEEPRLVTAAIKLYPSSWARAVRAAGLDASLITQRGRRWSREETEAWVRDRAKRGLSYAATAAPPLLPRGVRVYLGQTWIQFVESLGLRYTYADGRIRWSPEEVTRHLRLRAREGRSLRARRTCVEFPSLYIYAVKYHGSWDAALRKAGIPRPTG